MRKAQLAVAADQDEDVRAAVVQLVKDGRLVRHVAYSPPLFWACIHLISFLLRTGLCEWRLGTA